MWTVLLLLLLAFCCRLATTSSEWSLGSRRQQTCVEIPQNLSLCENIGYDKMRMPNLLDMEMLTEIHQQSKAWVPLLNLQCHPDTKLFLCSLFTPVCLDRPIYPCRSLCGQVRKGCEDRMKTYGFPWPEMFDCYKFPQDNDMCIRPQHDKDRTIARKCQVCDQVETLENILDNFCQAEFAIRTKIKRIKNLKLTCKKTKVLQGPIGKLKRLVMTLDFSCRSCEEKIVLDHQVYLIMGSIRNNTLLTPTFIMRWSAKHSKPFKRAIQTIKNLNCSDPKIVSHSLIGDTYITNTSGTYLIPGMKWEEDVEKKFTQKMLSSVINLSTKTKLTIPSLSGSLKNGTQLHGSVEFVRSSIQKMNRKSKLKPLSVAAYATTIKPKKSTVSSISRKSSKSRRQKFKTK